MKKNLFTRLSGLKGVIPLGLLLLFCFSCQKEEPQANLSIVADAGITFQDGRLIFKDLTAFINHQKWIFENQGNPELIAEKNKSYGLKSMTEYYLDGMKLEEDDPEFSEYVSKYPNVFYIEPYDNSTLYLLPHSKILCYIANLDGIYQVGDQIYRIAQNYIYQTGDESNIEMLFLPKNQISSKDVKVMPSTTRLEAKTDYGNRTENFYNDNRFRIVSSVRTYMNGPLLYYDICTNPQKKNFRCLFKSEPQYKICT